MIGLLEANHTALLQLCKAHRVQRLSVFGSAARTGDFDPNRSDLDFLVEFEPMSPRDKASAYFSLLFALEDLFGRPIDLLSQEGIKNPYVLTSIEADQSVLYAA